MKDGFIDHVALVTTCDGLNMTHMRPIHFWLNGKHYRIRTGATSDGLSSPRILWIFLPPFNRKYWLPANAHDGGYRGFLEVFEHGEWRKVTHTEYWDDRMILKLLISQGTHKAMAYTIYWALRLFGWKAFREDREKQPTTA